MPQKRFRQSWDVVRVRKSPFFPFFVVAFLSIIFEHRCSVFFEMKGGGWGGDDGCFCFDVVAAAASTAYTLMGVWRLLFA